MRDCLQQKRGVCRKQSSWLFCSVILARWSINYFLRIILANKIISLHTSESSSKVYEPSLHIGRVQQLRVTDFYWGILLPVKGGLKVIVFWHLPAHYLVCLEPGRLVKYPRLCPSFSLYCLISLSGFGHSSSKVWLFISHFDLWRGLTNLSNWPSGLLGLGSLA